VAKKYKITRKEIKQDDRFLATMKGVAKKLVTKPADEEGKTHVFRKYVPYFAIAIGVLLVLALVLWIYSSYSGRRAERMMAQADAVYRSPIVSQKDYETNPAHQALGSYTDPKRKWSDAAERYDKVIKAHPRSKSGIISELYAGNCYYELGEYETALNHYQEYLNKAGSDAPFASLAKQSIGYAYEALKRYDEAEKIFMSLTSDQGSTIALLSYFDLARIYETQKNYQKALETLKKIDAAQTVKSAQYFQLKRQADAKINYLQTLVGNGST